MYTEEGKQALHHQWVKRARILLAIELIMLAGIIYIATKRVEWAATLTTSVAGCFAVAYWELMIKPVRSYEKYQESCLEGRSHEVAVYFRSLEEQLSVVDGVDLQAMHCEETELDRHHEPQERLFYWDPKIQWPGFQEGQLLRVIYHDRALVSVEACPEMQQ